MTRTSFLPALRVPVAPLHGNAVRLGPALLAAALLTSCVENELLSTTEPFPDTGEPAEPPEPEYCDLESPAAYQVTSGGVCGGQPEHAMTLFADSFDDLDFTANPDGSSVSSANPGNSGTMISEVVESEPGSGDPVIRIARVEAPPDGAANFVSYETDIPLVPGALHLRYRVRLVDDQLNDGGWCCCSEYGAQVKVHIELADGSAVQVRSVHNYGTSSCVPSTDVWLYSAIAHDTWVDQDVDLSDVLAARGYPAPARLLGVAVGGVGWEFDGRYDDIEVTLIPDSLPNIQPAPPEVCTTECDRDRVLVWVPVENTAEAPAEAANVALFARDGEGLTFLETWPVASLPAAAMEWIGPIELESSRFGQDGLLIRVD
ncbi:MAG: hypothetical protein JRI25_22425, partial [Deltaproteobacteria bacterium]|nr:hypothetical protein [Deltaproteobacteria bacterium]